MIGASAESLRGVAAVVGGLRGWVEVEARGGVPVCAGGGAEAVGRTGFGESRLVVELSSKRRNFHLLYLTRHPNYFSVLRGDSLRLSRKLTDTCCFSKTITDFLTKCRYGWAKVSELPTIFDHQNRTYLRKTNLMNCLFSSLSRRKHFLYPRFQNELLACALSNVLLIASSLDGKLGR